jgi:hypothetical protein
VDSEPPSAPTGLRGNAFSLSWDASSDNSGGTNYVLFVDGQVTRAESGFDTAFLLIDGCVHVLPGAARHAHGDCARPQRAGNLSAPSNAITVEVP